MSNSWIRWPQKPPAFPTTTTPCFPGLVPLLPQSWSRRPSDQSTTTTPGPGLEPNPRHGSRDKKRGRNSSRTPPPGAIQLGNRPLGKLEQHLSAVGLEPTASPPPPPTWSATGPGLGRGDPGCQPQVPIGYKLQVSKTTTTSSLNPGHWGFYHQEC